MSQHGYWQPELLIITLKVWINLPFWGRSPLSHPPPPGRA